MRGESGHDRCRERTITASAGAAAGVGRTGTRRCADARHPERRHRRDHRARPGDRRADRARWGVRAGRRRRTWRRDAGLPAWPAHPGRAVGGDGGVAGAHVHRPPRRASHLRRAPEPGRRPGPRAHRTVRATPRRPGRDRDAEPAGVAGRLLRRAGRGAGRRTAERLVERTRAGVGGGRLRCRAGRGRPGTVRRPVRWERRRGAGRPGPRGRRARARSGDRVGGPRAAHRRPR